MATKKTAAGGGGGGGGGDFPWPWSLIQGGPGDDPTPFPMSLKAVPVMIRDLVGRQLRVVRFGDAVTQDVMPGRVSIFLGEDGCVADIWVEPELPTG